MAYIGWRFPQLSGGTRQTYTSNDIEGFKGEELIDNLARGTCQNSLDAKCKNVKKPVKVVFELRHISTRKYKQSKNTEIVWMDVKNIGVTIWILDSNSF